ncbi:hypothetical protein BDP55DRAFT_626241 [Colletotrichum godetiae]|uniref:Uncharacterized protein n=1 Tax=Colletotrichum godetiae TaxID=1209918 RepID=A0AAJ0B059_9PEZI|nr:uncharacterized protein BDP55DRAFT_626241 [Colletotrichum godetiae]KAK1700685.1 hypothetical protein BDP55DRAFT_626241 [Colletotrichum godetiae]
MDDQFGGRTDDDLFFDDFEPVSNPQTVETVVAPHPPPPPPAAVATPPVEPPKPATAPAPLAPKSVEQQQQQQKPQKQAPANKKPPTAPRGGLANSRFADPKPAPAAPRAPRQPASPAAAVSTPSPIATATTPKPPTGPAAQYSSAPAAAPTAPAADTAAAAATVATQDDAASPKSNSPAPATAPHAPREKNAAAAAPGANTALNAEARLGSGANPRTKLSESQLAAKMEQMRILNAEKTRKFEQAEQDERSHAEAYARGMEEARQRKKVDEERRRRGEEERRRMDDERAKNRERKLKAMSIKEGGWDEGKEALAAEEERRGFRGANGGVRGTRSAGLAGSRFASREDEASQGDRYAGGEERRGGRARGRGRGQGRGGRGGRGGYGNDHERGDSNGAREAKAPVAQAPAAAPVISTEEFPALPGKATGGDISPPVLSPLGRWDDEMEAFDEKLKSAAAQSSS